MFNESGRESHIKRLRQGEGLSDESQRDKNGASLCVSAYIRLLGLKRKLLSCIKP